MASIGLEAASAGGPPDYVFARTLAHYDVESIAEGDWVEYRTVETRKSKEDRTWFVRLACVKRGKTASRIEESRGSKDTWKKTTLLYRIDRKSGLATAAWWAGEDGEGEFVEVRDEYLSAMPGEAGDEGNEKETGKTSRETIKVGDRTYDCEKTEVRYEQVVKEKGKDPVTRVQVHTEWRCADVPFAEHALGADEKDSVVWDVKPERKGGTVRETHEMEGWSRTTELLHFGHDAKSTVKTK